MASIKAYTGRKEVASLSVDWTISKFKEIMNTSKTGENVQLDMKVGETKWKFELYANGIDEESRGNVSIFCCSENESPTVAKVSFSLKGGKVPWDKTFTFPQNFTEIGDNWGNEKFISHSDIKKNYLRNEDLEVVIKIIVYGDVKTTIKTEVSQNLDSIKMLVKSNLAADFKECWMNDEFSDVKIMCSGTIFNCHRIILARRSNYFRIMLKGGNFKESLAGEIVMENMEAETFKAVLKYIYEGELESLETNAMVLLEAAERFELIDLKNICEDFLTANYMKVDNVIDTLMMADLYKAEKLKEAAMDMIVSNSDKVIKQEGWKEKLKKSSHLVLEIFEAIGAQK